MSYQPNNNRPHAHQSKKQKGAHGERLVCDHLTTQGYIILDTNYTKRGGEVDIIARTGDSLCFVEVKVVDGTDDLSATITPQKLRALQRMVDTYIREHPSYASLQPQIDIAYVRDNAIRDYIPNAVWG